MEIKQILFLFFACTALIVSSFGQDTLYMKDYGIQPYTKEDLGDRINAVIRELPDRPVVLKFEAGQYDFYQKPSSVNTGLIVAGKDSLSIDGGGATFMFHGIMTVAYVHDSRNISLKNFKVDWARPMISQGIIRDIGAGYTDIEIDPVQYPYVVKEGRAEFMGENGALEIDREGYSTLYNPHTLDIEYLTRDHHLSHDNSLFKGRAEALRNNVVRFYGEVENEVPRGTILTLYHGRYMAPGIVLSESKNIQLEDLTLYHALSMGVLAERCENLYFNRVNMIPNRNKGRVFSGLADAFHLVSNKGDIEIRNCVNEGQGDDFANVRGVYIPITKINEERLVLDVDFHRSSKRLYFSPGDSIWFVSNETMQRLNGGKVTTVSDREDADGNVIGYSLTLEREIPECVDEAHFIENASWNPNLLIQNCYIGRRNRARGILVTTPGKVVIENNYFGTAGTAILVEGDTNYWYESGAIRDLLIHNNIFDNCGTSISSTGSPGEWGEAMITISPSFRPISNQSPAYHQNIRIENNIIRSFDIPLLMARSVDGLRFTDNVIIRTYDFKPFAWQKANIKLDGCKNVSVSNNFYSSDFIRKSIEIANMNTEDFSEF